MGKTCVKIKYIIHSKNELLITHLQIEQCLKCLRKSKEYSGTQTSTLEGYHYPPTIMAKRKLKPHVYIDCMTSLNSHCLVPLPPASAGQGKDSPHVRTREQKTRSFHSKGQLTSLNDYN